MEKPTTKEIVEAVKAKKRLAKKFGIDEAVYDRDYQCAFIKENGDHVIVDTNENDDCIAMNHYDDNNYLQGYINVKSIDEIVEALKYFADHRELPDEEYC